MSERIKYTNTELEEFRGIINEKIATASKDLDLLKGIFMNDGDNRTEDTSPSFKPFEDGSESMSKEANSQLAIRLEKFIRDLKHALLRIENKSYGVCRVTGELIPKERLRLVPHATLSVEGKNQLSENAS
jgi:RNA polymerase-binding transcription factor DksA